MMHVRYQRNDVYKEFPYTILESFALKKKNITDEPKTFLYLSSDSIYL